MPDFWNHQQTSTIFTMGGPQSFELWNQQRLSEGTSDVGLLVVWAIPHLQKKMEEQLSIPKDPGM